MSTKGNLELRLGGSTLYASCSHDGNGAYGIALKLLDFLDLTKEPTSAQYQEWFRVTSRELLPHGYQEALTGGVPSEVVIDVPRRLLLHTLEDKFPADFGYACITLREKYNYQIMDYANHEISGIFKTIKQKLMGEKDL